MCSPTPGGGADETTFFTTNVNPALLVQGTNLIAVEVHQQSPTSSDVSFDLRLTALTYSPPTLTFTPGATPFELNWPELPGGFVLESTANLSPEAFWIRETNSPIIRTNGFNRFLAEPEASPRFYRVIRP